MNVPPAAPSPWKRLLPAMLPVGLLALRLRFHPDPRDWVVMLCLFAAILPLHPSTRWRHAVLSATCLSLAVLYLNGQMVHVLAIYNLLP